MNEEELNEINLSIESLKLSLRLSNGIIEDNIDLRVFKKGIFTGVNSKTSIGILILIKKFFCGFI